MNSDAIVVKVSGDIREYFASAVISDGKGGFQTLARKLRDKLAASAVLEMSPVEFRRIIHYSIAYGDGGFQSQLRKIVVLWAQQQMNGGFNG